MAARIGTVLIVEDDQTTQDAYAEYLSLHGFAVLTAASGAEALETVRGELPDVILMDAVMPGIDGWTATRLLKSDPLTRVIPVVILTGHGLPEDHARARQCGADGLIPKPCVPDELVRRLKELVERPPSV